MATNRFEDRQKNVTSIQHRNRQQINNREVDIKDDTEPKRQLPTKFTLKKNVVSPHDHNRAAHVLQLNIGLRRKQRADRIGKGLDAGRDLFQRWGVSNFHLPTRIPGDTVGHWGGVYAQHRLFLAIWRLRKNPGL